MPETRTQDEALTAEPVVDAVSDPTPEAATAPADEAPVQGSDALGTMQENAEGDPLAMTEAKRGWQLRTPEIVAKAGGILPLVELLKSERSGRENASRALWQLAYDPDNRLRSPRQAASFLSSPSSRQDLMQRNDTRQRRLKILQRRSENQLALAKAKAIAPLVSLLGSDGGDTGALCGSTLVSRVSC